MKRLLSLLLCLCLVLPLMGAFPTAVSASTTPTADTDVLSVGKTVFAPGETITASAAYTVKNCWIGIIPADESGNPIRSQGTIYWKYVPEGGFDNVAFTTSDNPISGNKATKLAELMGVTVDEMLALPTGDYFMVHINSGDGIGTAHSKDPSLITYVPFKISQFEVEKTSFLYGLITSAVSTLLLFFAAAPVVRLFINNAETVAYGEYFLKIICVPTPAVVAAMMIITILQATGKKTLPLFLSMLRKGLLDIPFMYLMNAAVGSMGIPWATAIADGLTLLISVAFFLPYFKRLRGEKIA